MCSQSCNIVPWLLNTSKPPIMWFLFLFLFWFQVLSQHVFVPSRSPSGPFIFSVDHCFPIRGQGTVMTGTVLSGSIGTNDVSTPTSNLIHHITWALTLLSDLSDLFSSHSVSFLSHIDFILLLHFVSFQSLSWLLSKSVWALSKATVTSFQNNSGLIPKPLWHHSIATLASFQSYSGLILKTLWPHSKNSYGLIPKQLWPHSEATLTSVTFFMSCFMKFLQSIEIPFLKVVKKVKSMQMFRQPVQKASQV